MKNVAKWISGITFLILAITGIATGATLSAILFSIGAVVSFPFTLNFFQERSGFILPTNLKILIAVGTLILGAITIPDDSGLMGNTDSKSDKKATAATVVLEEAEPEAPKYRWEYSYDFDKMTNDTMYFATIKSDNTLQFKFPYDGGSVLHIIVRNMNGKNEILLKISKGQFMGGFSGDYLKIKYDDKEPVSVLYTSPDDGSSDVIFLGSPNTIISNLKKSKKVMIETTFYDEGRHVIEFSPEGLEWAH